MGRSSPVGTLPSSSAKGPLSLRVSSLMMVSFSSFSSFKITKIAGKNEQKFNDFMLLPSLRNIKKQIVARTRRSKQPFSKICLGAVRDHCQELQVHCHLVVAWIIDGLTLKINPQLLSSIHHPNFPHKTSSFLGQNLFVPIQQSLTIDRRLREATGGHTRWVKPSEAGRHTSTTEPLQHGRWQQNNMEVKFQKVKLCEDWSK